MIETILRASRYLICLLPFILFALLNMKANLKRQHRDRQFLMPVLTLLYCVVLILLLDRINTLLLTLLNWLPSFLAGLALQLSTMMDGSLQPLADLLSRLGLLLTALLQQVDAVYILLFVSNTLFLLAHIILKRVIVTILGLVFRSGGSLHDFVAGAFYEKDEETGQWHLRDHLGQARTFLKVMYLAALVLSVAAVLFTCELYREGLLVVPFYPVFGLLIVGEMYFFLDGLDRQEAAGSLAGEADQANKVTNYMLLRRVLTDLFGDKLGADNTTVDNGLVNARTNDELLHQLEQDEAPMVEAYGRFMRIRVQRGLELDHNYLSSGLELLKGNSILFNDPFYYDLIPYVSYPMNRVLLRSKKVLIVLGRHDVEGDVETWCRDGLTAVTGVPSLWNIGVLSDTPQDLDVGIVTRSSVHDLALHEVNDGFFREVEFVVIIEPSKLVTTAQIGLNSLIRRCRRGGKQLTFCSTDKNCDGLVDALSHILLTSLTEVSATGHHKGVSSYMCWETDGEHLQHRLLPNLSRYLGMGTELSFAALKNQVPQTQWFGGEMFPVVDIHWIASQYYYDLLHYANLPTSQETMDECFLVSPNLWNAKVARDQYLTVEDEAYNMFELKRLFSTRATNQGFINIISPEYLLKDYMTANDGIFNADPKAIPYIVADHAPTVRNVVLRLCLRMSAGQVSERDIRQELLLTDIELDPHDLRTGLWRAVCRCCQGVGTTTVDREGRELLVTEHKGGQTTFSAEVLRIKRKFSLESGQMEDLYFITDEKFISLLLSDLQNARYIAEDEKGDQRYLGTELRGHVFQKYLPGQFFTFGGKYYEMLRVTAAGQVLVRRAADHITGRPAYRQVRRYYLNNITDSPVMGEQRDIAGLQISKQYADIRVETPAYWQMEKYNDFAGGRKVSINGVPERRYYGKQILRIGLPEDGLTEEIRSTLTLLFNEVFRTLFAENHAYIAAVTPGETDVPTTYSLSGEGGTELGQNCIYIIEDSQLDLGLLVAVQRDLGRIFSILCDYLDWHIDAVKESQYPPPRPEPPTYTVGPEEEVAGRPEPKTRIGKIFRKIGDFFRGIGAKLAGLFGGLRKKKDKDEGTPEPETAAAQPAPEDGSPAEGTAQDAPVADAGEAAGEKDTEMPDDLSDAAGAEADEDAGTLDGPSADGNAVEAETSAEPDIPSEDVPDVGDEPPAENTTDTTPSAENMDPGDGADAEIEPKKADGEETKRSFSLMSRGPGPDVLMSDVPEAELETASSAEAEDTPGEEAPVHDVDQDEVTFEPDRAEAAKRDDGIIVRRPYHQRYYLLYGGTQVPDQLDIQGTHDFLEAMGFGKSELKQAREGVNTADMIERNFVPDRPGSKYCDFCGTELIGTEYEVLADGRERCMMCSRTAVKTEEEFRDIYKTVVRNLETFFDAKITAPVRVEMVNAKKLHRRLGKSFVPTGNFDGRVLGVAIRSKKGYSILLENGAPRMQSTMTIAHELTHIWQYLNWDSEAILRKYGKEQELEVYEGMAKWSEIQYAYLVGEPAAAKREELITLHRQDEYGFGFRKYLSRYPLTTEVDLTGNTPFQDRSQPL